MEPRCRKVRVPLVLLLPGGRRSQRVFHCSSECLMSDPTTIDRVHPLLPRTDLEFVLIRGRVVVANHKNKGPARVRIVFLHNSCTLTLREPGTEVALELFGRWPPGYPVTLRPISAEDTPTASLGILVIKGQA